MPWAEAGLMHGKVLCWLCNEAAGVKGPDIRAQGLGFCVCCSTASHAPM
jgi:hypothetical protein